MDRADQSISGSVERRSPPCRSRLDGLRRAARGSRGLLAAGSILRDVFLESVFPADCPACGEPLPGGSPGGVCHHCWASVRLLEPPHCAICALPQDPPLEAALGRVESGGLAPNAGRPGAMTTRAVPPFDSFGPERGRESLCAACRTVRPPFSRVIACASYEGKARELLHLFKFGDQPELARPLARLLYRRLRLSCLPPGTPLLPVPGRLLKRCRRGYSPTVLFGRELARLTTGPCLPGTLRKTRWTRDQAGLDSLAERRSNLVGAFSVPSSRASTIRGRTVILVDDILTTGSTASECARALRLAGADAVHVAVFARTPRLTGSLSGLSV